MLLARPATLWHKFIRPLRSSRLPPQRAEARAARRFDTALRAAAEDVRAGGGATGPLLYLQFAVEVLARGRSCTLALLSHATLTHTTHRVIGERGSQTEGRTRARAAAAGRSALLLLENILEDALCVLNVWSA
jgi:hypothetical protein